VAVRADLGRLDDGPALVVPRALAAACPARRDRIVTLSLFVFGHPLPAAVDCVHAVLRRAAHHHHAVALVLREPVQPARWIIIFIGFAGVLIALRPTGHGVFTWARIAILVGAFGYAVSAITVRVLGRTDSTQSMVFWVLTMMGFGGAALAAPTGFTSRRTTG